jgi:hypothetical protein
VIHIKKNKSYVPRERGNFEVVEKILAVEGKYFFLPSMEEEEHTR